GRVLVAAFETLPVVAEQQRAGRKHGRALVRTVLERTVGHRGDAHSVVHFLEWPVVRAGGADHVVDPPPRARCQEMRRRHACCLAAADPAGRTPAALPSSARAKRTTDRGCITYVACLTTGALSNRLMSSGDSSAVSIQRRHAC